MFFSVLLHSPSFHRIPSLVEYLIPSICNNIEYKCEMWHSAQPNRPSPIMTKKSAESLLCNASVFQVFFQMSSNIWSSSRWYCRNSAVTKCSAATVPRPLSINHHPSSIINHQSWSLLPLPLFAQLLLSHAQIMAKTISFMIDDWWWITDDD